MKPVLNRLSWCIGGAQGSGVDTAANLFARACAFGGLHVHGNREYYSNIMGEHSYFEVRVSDRPVSARTTELHVLTTFDAETPIRHSGQISPGGALIYDPRLEDTPFERLPALEARVRQDLSRKLEAQGLPPTLGSMLTVARQRGVKLYPIPFETLLKEDEALGQLPFATLKRMVNTMSVAASCALVGYDLGYLNRALEAIFAGKRKVIDLNARAVQIVYRYVERQFREPFAHRLEPLEVEGKRVYLNGNQAVALGKIAAGCSVQTYYPISPATDESLFLEAHENFALKGEKGRGTLLVLQTEDEIAAVTSAIGAALAGARAATSTSGPGFSLMAEGLGWAGINETPLVVTLYQRGGPSTGLPTRSEQGDLRFALHAGHGEFPRIVLASGDIEEAFYDAVRAFNYAERYQTPVIHLMDKSLASRSRTYAYFDLDPVHIERGALLGDDEAAQQKAYRRFAHTEAGISPRSALGQRGGISWYTGDEHTEDGHITEDPVERERMMEKRARKLALALEEIPPHEQFTLHGDPQARVTVISWGSTKGAILEAIERLNAAGHSLNFLQARLLCPLPAGALAQALARAELRVAVEENFSGQFAGVVREHTGIAMDHLMVKYNGRPIAVEEVEQGLVQILKGKAPHKVVLRHGV